MLTRIITFSILRKPFTKDLKYENSISLELQAMAKYFARY